MKKALTAVAAVAAFAFAAAPASAQDLIQHTLDTSADGWQVNANGKANIAVACTAIAKPNAVFTAVDQCYLKGDNGARYEVTGTGPNLTPGPATASVGATMTVPVQGYEVCVSAFAHYQDTTFLTEPVHCSTVYRFN